MDHAYDRREVVAALATCGWAWSIAVTDKKTKGAALRHLSDTASWTAISEKEEAADCWYRPPVGPDPCDLSRCASGRTSTGNVSCCWASR